VGAGQGQPRQPGPPPVSWDDLCSFSRTNFQVWRKAKSLPRGCHSRAVCGEILPSAHTAHEQDTPGAGPAESQEAGRGGRGKGWNSLHKKQDLWKLLPSHCTSSAKYTAFWHTPHFFPPPQFGILQEKHRQKRRQGGDGAERGSRSGHRPAVLQLLFHICTHRDHPRMFAACTDVQGW